MASAMQTVQAFSETGRTGALCLRLGHCLACGNSLGVLRRDDAYRIYPRRSACRGGVACQHDPFLHPFAYLQVDLRFSARDRG